MARVFIPFNTPSLKNSRVNSRRGSFHSKTVAKYLQQLGIKSFSTRDKIVEGYVKRPNLFYQAVKDVDYKKYEPLLLGLHPVRESKRKFDFHNCVQIIADLLTAHDIIEDDNTDYFIPMPLKIKGKYYTHNPYNPGIWLEVLNGKTLKL